MGSKNEDCTLVEFLSVSRLNNRRTLILTGEKPFGFSLKYACSLFHVVNTHAQTCDRVRWFVWDQMVQLKRKRHNWSWGTHRTRKRKRECTVREPHHDSSADVASNAKFHLRVRSLAHKTRTHTRVRALLGASVSADLTCAQKSNLVFEVFAVSEMEQSCARGALRGGCTCCEYSASFTRSDHVFVRVHLFGGQFCCFLIFCLWRDRKKEETTICIHNRFLFCPSELALETVCDCPWGSESHFRLWEMSYVLNVAVLWKLQRLQKDNFVLNFQQVQHWNDQRRICLPLTVASKAFSCWVCGNHSHCCVLEQPCALHCTKTRSSFGHGDMTRAKKWPCFAQIALSDLECLLCTNLRTFCPFVGIWKCNVEAEPLSGDFLRIISCPRKDACGMNESAASFVRYVRHRVSPPNVAFPLSCTHKRHNRWVGLVVPWILIVWLADCVWLFSTERAVALLSPQELNWSSLIQNLSSVIQIKYFTVGGQESRESKWSCVESHRHQIYRRSTKNTIFVSYKFEHGNHGFTFNGKKLAVWCPKAFRQRIQNQGWGLPWSDWSREKVWLWQHYFGGDPKIDVFPCTGSWEGGSGSRSSGSASAVRFVISCLFDDLSGLILCHTPKYFVARSLAYESADQEFSRWSLATHNHKYANFAMFTVLISQQSTAKTLLFSFMAKNRVSAFLTVETAVFAMGKDGKEHFCFQKNLLCTNGRKH